MDDFLKQGRDFLFEGLLWCEASVLGDDFSAPIDDERGRYCRASEILHHFEVTHHDGVVHPELFHESLDHG
jgi:hypothetical protein